MPTLKRKHTCPCRHKIPIDVVTFDYEVAGMDPALYTTAPAEGGYIHGLYLDGCGWDETTKRLCESTPKVLFVRAPLMWLRPRPSDKLATFPHYYCPMYRTAERKGVLATTGHRWVTAGPANGKIGT